MIKKLNVELTDFDVEISQINEDNKTMYSMKIWDDYLGEEELFFLTIDEALSFVKKVVDNSIDIENIVDTYNDLYDLSDNKKEKRIFLFPEDIDNILCDYFGHEKNYCVSIASDLSIEDDHPKIVYYLIEHLDYDGLKKDISTRMVDGDLKNAFQSYVDVLNYKVEEFKYYGGIHKEENIPYFEGIMLKVKEKRKILKR